jgi:hypothetical protein
MITINKINFLSKTFYETDKVYLIRFKLYHFTCKNYEKKEKKV